MITLRVVLDEMLQSGGVSRYTEELTRELIRTAPRDCAVAGIVASSPETDYEKINTLLPGLTGLYKTTLARRDLAIAWAAGMYSHHGKGMVHAPSLLAPMHRHDRLNEVGTQTVVTIHDTSPWTHPETLSPVTVAWHKQMAKRAQKHADAIVVPSHAVAQELESVLKLGDRIRVIGGAVASRLKLPVDADARAAALDLPERYILTAGTANLARGLGDLITAMATGAAPSVPLLIAGSAANAEIEAALAEHDLTPEQVRILGVLDDADLAIALDRATVFVHPGIAEGFGLPLIEALHFGSPVVHSDAPALVEVAAGSGLTVTIGDRRNYPERLAVTINRVLDDSALAAKLAVLGRDRAKVFSWRDSAEKVWQLHADL